VVIAMGTTFKGGIDNQMGINAILEKVGPPAVYRHQDAALFGSILGFLPPPASDLVNSAKMGFDSIAISGHKFWGLDEPAGLFISTQYVRDNINPFQVAYLKDAVPTITCSRSAISPLKLWWKITFSEPDVFEKQAAQLIANAEYLHAELQKLGIKSWLNEYSNTVFFQRPSQTVMDYYGLAPDVHPEQGELAHVLIMQHVSKDLLDAFIADMKKDFEK
jgi:histidine decarboxylase